MGKNTPRILLLNPPIHDFTAYDFWLKPYGLLRVAGLLRGQAELRLFDFMDRSNPRARSGHALDADSWGRGNFRSDELAKPAEFSDIPRRFRRFGLPREDFRAFLEREAPFDYALVQTVMTYWYPGVREAIEDLRAHSPRTRIILGGVYATLCPRHARGLGADLVIEGLDLEPLWQHLCLASNPAGLPCWDLYEHLSTGVLKLADGCPFKCSYCSVPQVYPRFHERPLERSLAEFNLLSSLGVKNIAFYDDALLYQPERILIPFLREVLRRGRSMNFHTPNALNARFISADLARLMVDGGFKTFYLGFESSTYEWQKKTGGKVYSHELEQAVENLVRAGADPEQITAYLILGHPQGDLQNVAASMEFASSLGIRVMLSDFSPIPGTPDGERCRSWLDLEEPLLHNKTAFPIRYLGLETVNRLKEQCRSLNNRNVTHIGSFIMR